MRRSPAILLALLIAACTGADSEEPPLRVDAIGEAAATALVADSVSAGLTGRDSAGRIVPGLAQSWRVSDDGLSIVFRLRPATFGSERKIMAADAVASVNRARSGGAGPLVRDLLAGVTRVSAPLEDVVEIGLSSPQPELLELLATPALAIRPRGRPAKNEVASAGPFIAGPEPVDAEAPPLPGPATRLTRNPDFFAADSVALAAATVRAQGAEVAVQRFNRGEVDVVLGGRLDGLGDARVTARRESLQLEQPRAALVLLINHKRGLLAERGVRNALQLAINREALGPELFGTQAAAPVRGLVPRAIAGYDPHRPDWAALPLVARQEEAKRLLAEAGVEPVAARLKLSVATTNSAAETRLMSAIAEDFAAVGVDIALVRRDPPLHGRAVADGDFDLALVRRDTPVSSPLPFLLPLRCAANRQGVCLPEADRLLAESWKAPTLAQRLAVIAAAERLWAEDGAAIGIVQPIDWSLVSQRVTGFSPNPSAVHALRHLAFAPDRKLLK